MVLFGSAEPSGSAGQFSATNDCHENTSKSGWIAATVCGLSGKLASCGIEGLSVPGGGVGIGVAPLAAFAAGGAFVFVRGCGVVQPPAQMRPARTTAPSVRRDSGIFGFSFVRGDAGRRREAQKREPVSLRTRGARRPPGRARARASSTQGGAASLAVSRTGPHDASLLKT